MEEQFCQYVSSRGIMKSAKIHSKTPQSSIRYLLNYNFDDITPNTTIYICSSAIQAFISSVLPTIKSPFVLISGDCDEVCPSDILNEKQFDSFINNNLIIHWFCQNNVIKHPKITTIPIGIYYHTIDLPPIKQEESILNITKIPFYERKIKCYSNFHFSMSTRFGSDRKQAYKLIPKDLVYYESVRIDRHETWLNQTNYAFVISPHGNGLDCHRTWEALILGCIPIVRKSSIDVLYEDLPVLIVDEWTDITQQLLNETVKEFTTKNFNMDKLKLEYWVNKFKSS